MITAAIPCYNAAPWLRAALESVLGQSRPVAELIVVDDGSTDASAAIASEYPVRLLGTGTNRGPAAARNLALREAAHDIVAWLDADDYWDPHHCAVVAPLLEAHPEAAAAFSAVREVGDRTGIWKMKVACGTPSRMLWESFDGTIVPAMSAFTRREAALAIGGYREEIRIAADFDFWVRLALRYPFIWTQEVTSNYRRHDRQISCEPDVQLRSIYRSRALVAQEMQAAGDLDLARQMRHRTHMLLESDLATAWWQADLPRVRMLLNVAHGQDIDTAQIRRLRPLSKMPAPLLQGWRAFQAMLDNRGA